MPPARLRHAPLDQLVERCATAGPHAPVAFLVGSGASIPAPALLPSAAAIVGATASAFAPAPRDAADRLAIARETRRLGHWGLPEIYYETLMDVVGQDVVEVWSVLDLWRRDARLARFGLGPSAVHRALALVAARSGMPLATTNFDLLLEEAARELGLSPDVIKLHGSVDEPETIRTTLRTITVTDDAALGRLASRFRDPRATVCLIGYSGRDLDLFPHICNWGLRDAWWLDLAFDDKHAIHRWPQGFRAVRADASAWADAVLARLSAPPPPPRAPLDVAAARTTYAELLTERTRAVAQRLLAPDDPRRRLVHALALYGTGSNREAARNLRLLREDRAQLERLPAWLQARALLLGAQLAHEFARYADSAQDARAARAATRGRGRRHPPTTVAARLHELEAERVARLPRLPVGGAAQLRSPAQWLLTIRFALGALTPLRHRWLRRAVFGGHTAQLDGSEIRATFEYVEHLVRLGAIVQGALETLLRRRLLRLLLPWWRWVDARSRVAGYAAGVANAAKYRERIEAPQRSPLGAGHLFAMFPSHTGGSLAHRDAGERLLLQAQHAAEPRRSELRREAFAAFWSARAEARRAGDPSLVLKAMVGMALARDDVRFPAAEVDALLAEIQSPAYSRARDALVALLVR
ncbi:MAG: hypothetical protein JSS99_10775 [Actinobacteria bacterium]|nr:hypothetical protein [Actinomycetota bacterium]